MSLTPFGYRNSGFLFDDLQRDMDALWALVPGDKQSQRAVGGWSPKVDVKESETQITVHADLPGVKKDDLHVELHDGVLTVSGKREATKSEKNDKYHYVERNFGSFSRSFRVPDNVTEEHIAADLSDGVLNVTVTKPKPVETVKKIKIGVNGK